MCSWRAVTSCVISLFFASSSFACFTVIAGKQATAAHVPLISRVSDTKDARRAKSLKIYTINQSEKLYIGLPYWDLLFDPGYDMAQVAINRYGVALSATQTIQSNRTALLLDSPVFTGQGVSEPNIPAIVMPHATTARKGIEILGKAIETRGVNDGWGFGVQIADQNEAWYLETLSGHQWVAIRIPDNMYLVAANGPGQIQEFLPEKYTYLFSHYQHLSPIQFANDYGFAAYQAGNVFNFRATYGDVQQINNQNNNYVRIAYAQHLLNPSTRPFNQAVLNESVFPMFLEPEHPLTRDDIKKIQMSHYEDVPEFDPYRWSYQTETPHLFYYPIANLRSSHADITEVRAPLSNDDVNISAVEYIALGMPGLSVYLPIYFGLNNVPTRLSSATNKADDHTLFWQFRKIQTLVFLHDPQKGIPYDFANRQHYVLKQYQEVEKYIYTKQIEMETAYQQTRDPNLVSLFTQDVVEAVSKKNEVIIEHFLNELSLKERYGLPNYTARNDWFTKTLQQQDCFYRRYHCDVVPLMRASNERKQKYDDNIEPND